MEKTGDFDDILVGSSRLISNAWGRDNAESGGQTIFGPDDLGWSWSWRRRVMHGDLGVPVSFPCLVTGKRVWDSASSTTSALPAVIASCRSASLSCEYSLAGGDSQRFNVGLNIWLQSPTGVRVELLILLNRKGDVHPHSDEKLQPALDSEIHRGTRRGNGITWDIYTFILNDSATKTLIDLAAFLDWIKKRGVVQDDWQIASFEFGTEIWNGSGRLDLRRYELELNGAVVS